MAKEKKGRVGRSLRSQLPAEEYKRIATLFAEKLERARVEAIGMKRLSQKTKRLLREASVWPGIAGFDDVAALSIPRGSGEGEVFFSFEWLWLDESDEKAIARSLIEEIEDHDDSE